MNPIVAIVGPLAAANAAIIVASNTPAGAGNLTLTASPYVQDKPRRVLVTYGTEGSARTILISGTNSYGNPISQTLAVPSGGAGTVGTTIDFATVTAVTTFAAWSAAMTVGTSSIASTPWFAIDWVRDPVNVQVGVIATGTVNYTLEKTYDDPNALTLNTNPSGASVEPGSNSPPVPWADATMAAKTSTSETTITSPYFAFRLTLNSGTGSLMMQAIQAGYRGA